MPLDVPPADDRPRPIEIKILGPYRIFVNGEEITKGLRSAAKELLCWYLLRPHGATAEAAVEALWPETDPALVIETVLAGTRQPPTTAARSRRASSDTDVIFKSGDRYLPDIETIGCDLWDFQRHLDRRITREEEAQVVRWTSPSRRRLRRRLC